MVDIMTTPPSDYGKPEDFEDGELVEDGEIQDEEDNSTTVLCSCRLNANFNGLGGRKTEISSEACSSQLPPLEEDSQHPPVPVNQQPPPAKAKAPRGYGDDLEAVAPSRGNIWGPQEGSVENFEGDRDYRFVDDAGDFGDSDYRQNGPSRRRKLSPSIADDFDGPRGIRGARPWRGGFKKPKWATEHQICKFFREGYCRDGDQCTYSHQAEDSLRKPELCRFYANGYCKKGLTCLALHGEFPCVPFQKGECNAEHCRYSHLPLTEYTQPLYDQKVKDGEMGMANRGPPFPPARRRVLLPNGPENSAPPPVHPGPIHAPLPQPSNGQLPPPSVVVPTTMSNNNAHHHYPQMPPRGSFFPPAPAIHQSPRVEEQPPPGPTPQPLPSAPAPAFDISSMLAKIAGETVVNDSPASPPMFGETSTEPVRTIPDVQEIAWRLVPIEIPRRYLGVEPNMSMNDPRLSKVVASQFDAVTNLFANEDPRIRDPRRRPDEKKPTEERPRISSWMPQIA